MKKKKKKEAICLKNQLVKLGGECVVNSSYFQASGQGSK